MATVATVAAGAATDAVALVDAAAARRGAGAPGDADAAARTGAGGDAFDATGGLPTRLGAREARDPADTIAPAVTPRDALPRRDSLPSILKNATDSLSCCP